MGLLGKPAARNTPNFAKTLCNLLFCICNFAIFILPAAIQFLSAPGAATQFLQKSSDFAKTDQVCKIAKIVAIVRYKIGLYKSSFFCKLQNTIVNSLQKLLQKLYFYKLFCKTLQFCKNYCKLAAKIFNLFFSSSHCYGLRMILNILVFLQFVKNCVLHVPTLQFLHYQSFLFFHPYYLALCYLHTSFYYK